ncbi:MAG: ABC transporter ATP-binding protein [Methanomassiliicoccales archaeon]|nr:ABC transporter ATP-binding protein [Methanomassiliicoccales archaeon]
MRNGEYLCLLGPTGAGKTTILRIISGLTIPDQGNVIFDGISMNKIEPEDRRAVMLSQSYALFPQLTVADNILFGPDIRQYDQKVKQRTLAEMLDLVRLTHRPDAYPSELSGGMMQRTALARALASGASVLLLDEPLRALDARLRISLRHELRSLAKSMGITTIHVTHDQDEALVMADRIAVIREGRVVQVGTPGDVFDNPASPFVANFVGQSNFFIGTVEEKSESTSVRGELGHVVMARPCDHKLGEKVVVGVKVGNTEVHKEGEGYFDGTVERILFEGRNIFLDVDVSDVGRFSAKIPSWRLGRLAVGDKVKIKWSADKAIVFSMPLGGLEKELRVE